MDSVVDRVVRCFGLVFPDAPKDRIPHATVENEAGWDSVNMATLMTVIEEEFGITLDYADIEQFDSFSNILRAVERAISRPSQVG